MSLSISEQSISPKSSVQPGTEALAWLTVEHALYALLVLVAAGLRLLWLDKQPLNALEAGHGWAAWLAANAGSTALAPAPDSPLLSSLYTLFFWVWGATGDAATRWIPALCGTGLVVLIWYWRTWLGRSTAFFAAALLALDPWLTAYSRLADSTMITIFLAMLTLTGLLQSMTQAVDDEPSLESSPESSPDSSSWRNITALSFGLLVISGPQSWSFLVVLGLFGWFCLADADGRDWLQQSTFWWLAGGAALVGATGWLANPAGLGAISTSLSVWISQITGSNDTVGYSAGYTLSWFLWRLIVDQPFILLFGLFGLIAYWRDRPTMAEIDAAMNSHGRGGPYLTNWRRFLTAWLFWGLLLVILPGRTPLTIGLVGLPLLFLAAYALTGLLQPLLQPEQLIAWQQNSLLMAVLTVLLISFSFWLAGLTTNATFDSSLARTLLIILVLIFLIILAYTLWIDGRQARLTAGILLALLLLGSTISSTWQLNQRFDLAYPDGFLATYSNPDIRRLAEDVQTVSAQRKGDAGELPLQVEMVEMPDPVLGWYLRDMRNLAWVLAPGINEGQSPPVVITLGEDSAVDQLAASYMGSRYAVRDHWLPATLTAGELTQPSTAGLGFGARLQERIDVLWPARWRPLLRWMLYREVPTLPPNDQVILWVMAEASNP